MLTGLLRDQAALLCGMAKVRDIGITLNYGQVHSVRIRSGSADTGQHLGRWFYEFKKKIDNSRDKLPPRSQYRI